MTVNNSGTNKFRNESDLKIDLFLISEKKQKETYYNAEKKVYSFQKYIGLVCFYSAISSYFQFSMIFHCQNRPKIRRFYAFLFKSIQKVCEFFPVRSHLGHLLGLFGWRNS